MQPGAQPAPCCGLAPIEPARPACAYGTSGPSNRQPPDTHPPVPLPFAAFFFTPAWVLSVSSQTIWSPDSGLADTAIAIGAGK